ncbi:MAG: HTH domain-containing protein [Candidatus Omnitrophota bacterium]
MDNRNEEIREAFVNCVNQICSKFGLNNVMAQLYVILYLSDEPLSLDDMVEQLNISKATASNSVRALERYNAVRHIWVKGSRKDYYRAETNISKVIMDRVKSMGQGVLTEFSSMIEKSYEVINHAGNSENGGDLSPLKDKLDRLNTIYGQAKSLFDLLNSDILQEMISNGHEPKEAAVLTGEEAK